MSVECLEAFSVSEEVDGPGVIDWPSDPADAVARWLLLKRTLQFGAAAGILWLGQDREIWLKLAVVAIYPAAIKQVSFRLACAIPKRLPDALSASLLTAVQTTALLALLYWILRFDDQFKFLLLYFAGYFCLGFLMQRHYRSKLNKRR